MDEKMAKEILTRSVEAYDKIAKEFSRTRQFFWEELDFVKEAVKEGDKVLDLGCGNGRFFEALKNKKINYTGIDSSKELIKIAGEKYGGLADFIRADALEIPFEKGAFDTVASFAVLHHIPSRKFRKKFLTEANRVLKKDGLLILSAWNLWQRKYLPILIKYAVLKIVGLSKLDFKDIYLGWGRDKKIRFLHAFTKKELEKIVADSGFSIKKSLLIKRKTGQSNLLIIAAKT